MDLLVFRIAGKRFLLSRTRWGNQSDSNPNRHRNSRRTQLQEEKVCGVGFPQMHRKSAAGISTGGEKFYLIEVKTDRFA
jgi:hypothetical protein